RLDAPAGWYRDSLFTAISASRETAKATYQLDWQPDGSVAVTRLAPTDSTVGSFAAGEPLRFDGIELVPGVRRAGAPTRVRLAVIPFAEAAHSLQNALAVVRTRREANVLEVSYTGTDPKLTRAVVRSGVDDFIELRSQLYQHESGQTVDSLRGVAQRTR